MTIIKSPNYKYFIGVDISRNKLDFAVLYGHEFVLHKEVANAPVAISHFIIELKSLPKFRIKTSIFCMENTGIYTNHLLHVLKKLKANIVSDNPLHIKRSMGLVRSKEDKLDAIRIAQYAYRHKEHLHLWMPRRPVLEQLSHLNTMRNRLLTLQGALKTPLAEGKAFIQQSIIQRMQTLCARSIDAVKADLEAVDADIDRLVQGDARLSRLYQIITSVPCIGRITAIQIIISTNEYQNIRTARKFACFAGVAPFKRESGTIQRKARVSLLANKRMKSLLHICAMSSLRYNKELKAYYDRKTIQENKPKMLAINALRFKLLTRIFACLAQDRLYTQNYTPTVSLEVAATPVVS